MTAAKPAFPRLNRAHPLADGLTSAWIMAEGSGVLTRDVTGREWQGTLFGVADPGTGTSGWFRGEHGAAILFDGVNDRVDTNGIASNFVTASTGTIVVWMRPVGTPVARANVFELPAVWHDALGFLGIHRGDLTGTGDGIYVYNFDNNADSVRLTYTVNVLTQVVWQHSGGTLFGYKDGVLVGSTASGNTSDLTNTVSFSGVGFDYTGEITSILTYDRALSAQEIAWLYAEPYAMVAPPRATLWGAVASSVVYDTAGVCYVYGTRWR